MKNKMITLTFFLFSFLTYSWEVNVKSGFDYLRASQDANKSVKDTKLEGMGFILGSEVFPFEYNNSEVGVGFEYNFGINNNRFKNSFQKNSKIYAPMYIVARNNFYSNKINRTNIYAFGRIGGAYTNYLKGEGENLTESIGGAFYFGGGLGFNLYNILNEITYETSFSELQKNQEIEHKLGFRFGVRLGSYRDKIENKVKSNKYIPKIRKIIASKGEKITNEDVLNHLVAGTVPYGTNLEIVKNVNTNRVGNEKLIAKLIYPDGKSSDHIVDVKIIDKDRMRNNLPVIEDMLVRKGDEITTTDVLKHISNTEHTEGVKVYIVKNADTSKIGIDNLRVKLKYLSGKDKLIDINVNIKPELLHTLCDVISNKCTIYGFGVDKYIPESRSKENLKEIISVLNKFKKKAKIVVVGHTDSTASFEYNNKLSLNRAKYIAKKLREYGLSKNIIITQIKGRGEYEPEDTNNTILGRYNNRRVEIIFEDIE